MAGRKPKPRGLRVLEGNTGKRSKEYQEKWDHEKIVDGDFPVQEPPSWLTDKAKEEWQRLAGPMVEADILKPTDMAMFASYCQAYGEKAEMEEALVGGRQLLGRDESGRVMLNPLLKYLNQRSQEMYKLAGEFGLTPTTRARLSSQAWEAAKEDPMDALLSRRPG